MSEHVRVAIAGSGFGGLGMAVALLEEGIDDFVLLERGDDVGGTWRDNVYPGCACDVPSHLYSFSFAPNPEWSRTFSPQAEIHAYLRDVADRFGVRPFVRFGCALEEAAWNDDELRWRIDTARGTVTADVFVSSVGALSEPLVPALPGLQSFAGTSFHSAWWDHDHDLTGRSVAVVGTGASAIQFVPQIQPRVGRLTLLQRTPPWILPRPDRPLTRWEHELYRRLPAAQRAMRESIYWGRELFVVPFMHPRLTPLLERAAKRYLRAAVPDPELRAKLTPDYRIGCKRVLISNDYLPSLTQRNVEVVTEGIREVRPHAVVTADGREHPVDTIIFGTGFRVTEWPVSDHIRGRGGRTLGDTWRGSPAAHLGTTVAGFPNLFMLLGPNTGLGHNSVVFMIESQVAHVIAALRHLDATGAAALEPRPEVQAAYNAEVDRRMRGTVWTSGGCESWYLDETGRNSTLWPGFTYPFKRRLERFEPADYQLVGAPAVRREAVPA